MPKARRFPRVLLRSESKSAFAHIKAAKRIRAEAAKAKPRNDRRGEEIPNTEYRRDNRSEKYILRSEAEFERANARFAKIPRAPAISRTRRTDGRTVRVTHTRNGNEAV